MKSKISFPLRHISMRVPWHDFGWNGTICQYPSQNTTCLKLKNIFDNKNDIEEEKIAGKSIRDLDPKNYPPCVKEGATFMADFSFDCFHEHPYTKTSPDTHAHFKTTCLNYPAYSAAGIPYRWLLKAAVLGEKGKNEYCLLDDYQQLLGVNVSYEPNLSFKVNWFEDHRNHRSLLDFFWNHIQEEESLVFFYAKQIPLVESTNRRVLIGVGRVLDIGNLNEYEYSGLTKDKIRSLLWERMIKHSIRPDFKDGFLLPYHEALEKSDAGRNFNPAEIVAYAPEDRFVEFSYATEHVSNDAAISSLLSCRTSLLRAAKLFNYSIREQEKWIDQQLGRLWKKRGAFPGLGAVLAANGVSMGHFIARALVEQVGEEGNPWEVWENVLKEPQKYLPADLAEHLDSTIAKVWQKLSSERRLFLELLSRIDLNTEQANIIAIPEIRKESGIDLTDKDFLKNPYLFYETTRLNKRPISIGTVDRGMFPTTFIRERYPIPPPSDVKNALDTRRIRALVICELEEAALLGDTLKTQADIITTIRRREEADEERCTAITADLLAVVEDEQFTGEIRVVPMADGNCAYQLERLGMVGDIIRSTINKRIEGQRHEIKIDWRAELDNVLKDLPIDPEEKQREERARQEKAAALAEISASRFSVLIGSAGTGKTTLLSILCQQPEIYRDGVLLLAPTGKARVRMEDVAKRTGTQNFSAQTVAQFLIASGRYDWNSQRYFLTGKPGQKGSRTVIIDECSMLTEEMMAAVLEALSGVHRLIFVGDHRQLPPIGTGRPFVDIIAKLQPSDIENRFPRVDTGYAELTVPRRQDTGDREDLQLASWFGGDIIGPGEDQVFEILAGHRKSENIQFIPWNTPDELEQLIPEVLAETLKFDSKLEEWQAFACSLGGQMYKENVYFNRGKSGEKAEAWQILSPVRQNPWGVELINRQIHLRYKSKQVEASQANVPPGGRRLFIKPCGDQKIVYGDKIINNSNRLISKEFIYPTLGNGGYLANGEIGMVVGQIRTKKYNFTPKFLEIEFSTQLGTVFKFYPSMFGEDGNADIELAYALTVHKAQGSEFEVVFLVLPRSPIMITRELLYTALTRQKQKIIIFSQGSVTDLLKYSSEQYSATATRLTNLFYPPNPVAVGNTFLEKNLIHRTERGEAVRSKSEVIIADKLHRKKLNYQYEFPLEIEGIVKYPDFTIEDDDTGKTYYWEHCGMLIDPDYLKRWKEKEGWYNKNGIKKHNEDPNAKQQLIVTEDKPDGGIDSQLINNLIKEIFG